MAFRDVPEAITQGEDHDDALAQAADALDEAIAGRIRRGDPIPVPTRTKSDRELAAVLALTAAKAALYLALQGRGVTKAELARRLGCDEREVRRLLDPRHPSKLPRIQQALAALGRTISVRLLEKAGSPRPQPRWYAGGVRCRQPGWFVCSSALRIRAAGGCLGLFRQPGEEPARGPVSGVDRRSPIGYHRHMARLLSSPTVAGSLILQARLRANLSQRELAGRAATAQSTITAYERGHKQPTLETLIRLLRAAGFDLRMRLELHDDHDETLAAWRKTLAEEDRHRFEHNEAETVARLKAAQGWT